MAENQTSDVTAILRTWEEEYQQPNYDPEPTLTRLAEILESETENYLKMDPDPFDERHPSRADPECQLGHILKVLFRKDVFMSKVVTDYLRDTYWSRMNITGKDVNKLNIAACRLLIDTLPGLETSAVFQPDMDGLINRLLKWALNSPEPLQSYATGLLAAAVEVSDIAIKYREQNGRLIPIMLQRLRKLQSNPNQTTVEDEANVQNENNQNATTNGEKSDVQIVNGSVKSRPFAQIFTDVTDDAPPRKVRIKENGVAHAIKSPVADKRTTNSEIKPITPSDRKRTRSDTSISPNVSASAASTPKPSNTPNGGDCEELSNSSWAELEPYVIGTFQMYPLTPVMQQMLILRYLTPMGEYQEFLSHIFEHNALGLIMDYIKLKENRESRLAFEALKYLAALLCHKKFSIEFISVGGLQKMLEIPRPSVAATGVSICLYYLAYCEDAMERVCFLSDYVITRLVRYTLWLLECSHHDSARCHGIMFFGMCFQFKVILDAFDKQDGLRTLINVISTLPILSSDDVRMFGDDVVCAARQIVRQVCVALKRYLEAHLFVRSESLKRSVVPILPYKAMCKITSPTDYQERIENLMNLLPYRATWPPVEELLRLGALQLLLKIIAFAYDWNYSGRSEAVRSALDVLGICSVVPKVQLLYCERIDLPDDQVTVGLNIILGAAEGEIVADAEVQKAALGVIVNCVCAPINRLGNATTRLSSSSTTPTTPTTTSPRRKTVKSSEEIIQKVWDCVRSNNGIMVLVQLMQVKTPITDADCIRTLACCALAGLARSDTVKQIVGKLPLLTNGQLQTLMRDPILQEKRQEHVQFQKYALELMECLAGKPKTSGTHDMDVSLANIHRANVVAHTKIQFNEEQLLLLIHQYLSARGLKDAAELLRREAQLNYVLPTAEDQNIAPPLSTIRSPFINSIQTPSRFTSPIRSPRTFRQITTPEIAVNSLQSLPSSSTPVKNFMSTPARSLKTVKSALNAIKVKIYGAAAKSPLHQITHQQNVSRLEKQIACCSSDMSFPTASTSLSAPLNMSEPPLVAHMPRVSLDSIITEYLTNQHALCKNPMATCPQFNLFEPHKCPDPKPKFNNVNNFVMRNARRAMGYSSYSLDKRFIHSSFCPVQSFRHEDDGYYSFATFMPNSKEVALGHSSGVVKIFSIYSGLEEKSYTCHDCAISNLQVRNCGELLLTSSSWRRPLSALWKIDNTCSLVLPFNDEEYAEFSHLTQDKIIGTKGETANIYDIQTKTKLLSLKPLVSNQYTKNKATFNPTDELVLSDGVLWDATSNTQIHKFDKLNQMQSGVFHPNGLQVISNMEVWDLRTFHLLRTVPALNRSQVVFNPFGDVIYSYGMEIESDEDSPHETCFKTLDAVDYSSIATLELKKHIYCLSVNKFDTQIVIVENVGNIFDTVQESVVRLYDVGRKRDDEDEQEEDDDDEDGDRTEDRSGSGSSASDDDNLDSLPDINMLFDAVAAAARGGRRRGPTRGTRRSRRSRNSQNIPPNDEDLEPPADGNDDQRDPFDVLAEALVNRRDNDENDEENDNDDWDWVTMDEDEDNGDDDDNDSNASTANESDDDLNVFEM